MTEAGTNSAKRKLEIQGIQPEFLEFFWPNLESTIKRALEGDTLVSLEGLYNRILEFKHQLWIVTEKHKLKAVCITEIQQYDLGKSLEILLLAGEEMDIWLPALHQVMESFGKQHQCVAMRQNGRKGWAKVLKEHGWKVYNICLVRQL